MNLAKVAFLLGAIVVAAVLAGLAIDIAAAVVLR